MFTTLRKRWKAEMPDFFKKTRNAAISIGISAVAVWGVNAQMNLELDQTVLDVCKYTIAACAAIAGTAQFTAKNPENL